MTLPQFAPSRPDPLLTERRKRVVADIRANGRTQGWSETRVVEGIWRALRIRPLAAYRLWRGWTLAEAVATIRAAAAEAGVERVFGTADLEDWEAGRCRVPVELLGAVCLVYQTRPDLIGYQDYSDGGV